MHREAAKNDRGLREAEVMARLGFLFLEPRSRDCLAQAYIDAGFLDEPVDIMVGSEAHS